MMRGCTLLALGRKSRQRNNFVRYLGVQQTRQARRCHAISTVEKPARIGASVIVTRHQALDRFLFLRCL
jgi:hypothetical protein